MLAYEAARTIDAPPETIWALLTDAAAYPGWNPTVAKIEGRIALGGKIAVHATISPGRAFKVKVSEFSPPKSMTWSGGMPFGLFGARRTFALAPQEDGSTVFHMREEFSGPLLPLIGKTIPDLQPAFEEFADALKARAESAS
jgi:hypothetical protein